jgi:hypothetical protein
MLGRTGVSAGQESITGAEAGATPSQERRPMTSVTVFVKMCTYKLIQLLLSNTLRSEILLQRPFFSQELMGKSGSEAERFLVQFRRARRNAH